MSGRYLLGRVAVSVLLAIVVLIALELMSATFGPHLARQGAVGRLWRSMSPDHYEALVGAIASVGGVLLALYFTTVGVVASNSYSSVPGQLRQLFLAERTGSWYIRLLAWTVALSVLVLGCRIVGYEPHVATIAVLTVAAVTAVFMLAILGSRLFVFFDLTALAAPLPRRWKRILRSASRYGRRRRMDVVPRGFGGGRLERFLADAQADGSVSKDLRLCTSAQAILDTYREIVTVLVTADGGELRPLTGLGINLATCWLNYAAVKSAIPTRSRFYRRRYEHPNVLTADESSRQFAVSTRTFVQPKPGPDYLWVERDLADRLDELLRRLLSDADWSEALQLLDTVSDLAAALMVKAQTTEALLLWQRVSDRFWLSLAEGPATSTRIRTPQERLTYQLAAAEMVPRILTRMWFVVMQAAEAVQPEALQSAVLEALYLPKPVTEVGAHARGTPGGADKRSDNSRSALLEWLREHIRALVVRLHESRAGNWALLYALGAPHPLLERLEVIASRLDVERFAERHPVTPAWWVADQVGLIMTRVVSEAGLQISDAIRAFHIDHADQVGNLPAPVAAQLTLAGLEALDKIRANLPRIQCSLSALRELQHPAAGQEWPIGLEAGRLEEATSAAARHLERCVAKLLPQLPASSHDPAHPDYYGQSYVLIFDVVFEAIMAGDDEHATALFPALFAGTWLANDRLAEDLVPWPVQQQALFGTEPLVDVMALCGYARIFTSIHGHGIWGQIRDYWDMMLSSARDPRGIVRRLILSLGLRENLFMLTTGAVRRTQMRTRAGQAMAAAGLTGTTGFMPTIGDDADEDSGHQVGHPDPAVTAFSMGPYAQAEAEELFVVEYLRHRPEASGIQMPRGVTMLAERIDELSGQAGRAAGTPASPEPGRHDADGAPPETEHGDTR